MTTALFVIFILACIVLIVSVLLQPGKADAGALFSSGISSTAFGPRGTQTLLAKITIGAAAVFMLTALALSLPALTGQRSVLQSVSEEEEQPAPQASPGAQPAPTIPGEVTPAPQGADPGTTNTSAPAATTPAQPVEGANTAAPPAPSK